MMTPTEAWQAAYAGGFATTTESPSPLLIHYQTEIPAGTRAADLGCGNGRNAAYLAMLGFEVEACDLVDLDAKAFQVPAVKFTRRSAVGIEFSPGAYGIILAMELLPFLPLGDVESLIRRAAIGLARDGLLMLSFSVSGGIHDTPEVGVPKYQHEPRYIDQLLADAGLYLDFCRTHETEQTYVQITRPAVECELVAIKRGAM